MGKILVVDNQFGVRRLLVDIFQDDHEVEVAENGEEALRLVISFEPDLILLDMKMPGMNGIETLVQIRALGNQGIRESGNQVGVIMMTADGDDPRNMCQAKYLGAFYYMVKPFDLFELKERVKEILNSLGTINTIS